MRRDKEAPPKPVLMFVALLVLDTVAVSLLANPGDPFPLLTSLAISVAICWGLWVRKRVAWFLGVGLALLGVVAGVGRFPENGLIGLMLLLGGIAEIALLAAPSTRRWVGD